MLRQLSHVTLVVAILLVIITVVTAVPLHMDSNKRVTTAPVNGLKDPTSFPGKPLPIKPAPTGIGAWFKTLPCLPVVFDAATGRHRVNDCAKWKKKIWDNSDFNNVKQGLEDNQQTSTSRLLT